jgi:pyrimidine operon attenuation protein/uracil phosphoribosyltransferase
LVKLILNTDFWISPFTGMTSEGEMNLLCQSATHIDFVIEDKNVILVDDVLYTGRTIRAALDAILAFGRPRNVELMVLIDRKFSRQLPIQADYIGASVDSLTSQRVKVNWQETDGKDEVILYTPIKVS